MLRRRPDGSYFRYKLWTGVEHAMPILSHKPLQFDKYDLIDLYPMVQEYHSKPDNYEVLDEGPTYKVLMSFTRNLADTFMVIGFNPTVKNASSIFLVIECGIATVPHTRTTAIVQGLLWRDSTKQSFHLINFVLEHILTQVGAVMSDTIQTEQGKSFWLRLTDSAYARRCHVYVVDSQGVQDVTTTPTFIRENATSLWASDKRRIVISRKPVIRSST